MTSAPNRKPNSFQKEIFDVIKQDPWAWAGRVEKETSTSVTVMKPGHTLKL